MFSVTVNYEAIDGTDEEPKSNPTEDGKESQDPLEWLDEVEVSFTQIGIAAEFGTFHGFQSTEGNEANNPWMQIGDVMPISDSARVPYDPPIEKEKDIRVIRITRNVFDYDLGFFDQYQGAVNSDLVVIAKPLYRYVDVLQPLTARIRVIGGRFNVVNGKKFWQQSIEIHVDRDGWRRQLLDRGMQARRFVGDPGGPVSDSPLTNAEAASGFTRFVLNKDAAGGPIPAPLLFNGNGQPLTNGAAAFYGTWGIYRELPFTPLKGRAW
jgi:hypothetical protein